MLGLQAKAEAVIEHSPHVAHVASIVGGGGPTNTLNNGRFFVELKPKGERPELADGGGRSAPRARAHPRPQLLRRAGAESQLRRPAEQEPVPVRGAGPRPGRARRLGAAARGSDAAGQDVHRRHRRSREHRAAGADRHRPRQGPRARHHRRAAPLDALQRLRLAADLDHLRDRRQLPGDRRVRPAAALDRRAAGPDPGARGLGQAGAALGLRPCGADGGAAHHQPARPAPGRHGLVQSAGRRVAGRRGAAAGGDQGRPRRALDHQHDLLRHRPGVPGRPRQPGPAAAGGRDHDLHRARHPLRELHPPADDPDRPARGGGGCAWPHSSCSGSTSA